MKSKTIFLLIFILLSSCSKNINPDNELLEKDLNLQVLETYNEALDSLKSGDVLFAAKKFNEVEIMFPQSSWAPKSALMAAYSYYSQDYYLDAIIELERFIKIYSLDKNLDYAYYLLAISYYEQIVDEKKDLESIIKSKEYFTYLLENFPTSDYAIDATFKIDLVNDVLASKEIYLGRYYLDKKKWIPAINIFKNIIEEYETTIYVEEALHRLVEIHYLLGLNDEALKYANLLGYNYQSSKWYEKTYRVFNKMYENNSIDNNKNKKMLKKIKSFFNSDE